MWYWIRFALRAVARAGLSVVVFAVAVGQFGPIGDSMVVGSGEFTVYTHTSEWTVMWLFPKVPLGTLMTDLKFNGVRVLHNGPRHVWMEVDHWLLLLMFLMATAATSRKCRWH